MILRGNVFSETLGMDTGIVVVTPHLHRTEGPYRVAYLLHGLCGDSATWADYSMLPAHAGHGKTIYVMPEVARSFYTDMRHGFRYFTYVTEELPELCRRLFNISAAREDTAVIGGSMGGYGALKCALSKPERYGMCAAFSSACLFLKEGLDNQRANGHKKEFIDMYGAQLIADFASIFGEDLEWKPEYEILELAKKAATSEYKPAIYATCGTEDFLRQDNRRFAEEMEKTGLDFTYEEWPGEHDFPFFDASLKKAIERFGL